MGGKRLFLSPEIRRALRLSRKPRSPVEQAHIRAANRLIRRVK